MGFKFGPGARVDRGTRRGAKRMIVTEDLQLLDHAVAKQHGIKGRYFQSKAEAIRWIALCQLFRAGHIRELEPQVKFPLHVVRPDGLKEKIGSWTCDFRYLEKQAVGPDETIALMVYGETPGPLERPGPAADVWRWIRIVEDVKGNPEDLYKWKRLHFEAEYGIKITERKAWGGTGRR